MQLPLTSHWRNAGEGPICRFLIRLCLNRLLSLSLVFPSVFVPLPACGATPKTVGCPHGLTFTWWGCGGLCLYDINQPSLPTPFYSVLVSVSVFMVLSNGISFHKFSQQLSTSSLCSSGLISALSVLSTVYIFTKVSFSPDYNPLWLTGRTPTN